MSESIEAHVGNSADGQDERSQARSGDLAGAEDALPIFDVLKVDMKFQVTSDYAAAQVANSAVVLGLRMGRILRIDLDAPEEVQDIDLPKKPNEVGVIKRMFLDPTASHLIVSTTLGENFYLHAQSRQPKQLSKMRGVSIESISWNPSQPTASTREILIGAIDGTIYETYIETTTEFYRREEKYLKTVYRVDGPISGLWTDLVPGKSDMRRIMVATPKRLLHFIGRLGRHGHEGSGSIFAKLFESESPTVREINTRPSIGAFAVTPEADDISSDDSSGPEPIFAWLSSEGIFHGRLLDTPVSPELGSRIFAEAQMLPTSELTSSRSRSGSTHPTFMALSQWHILQLVGDRFIAVNRLDNSIVCDQIVLPADQKPIALTADLKKNTYWLFTSKEILEIAVQDEDRDIWKVLLNAQKFEAALQYANNAAQKDIVATASGDYLIKRGKFMEAAAVYGKSSKPFEQVALAFIDQGERDALRKYLMTKLASLNKSAAMQRTMLATWITETFMAKLNTLDDNVTTKSDLSADKSTTDAKTQRDHTRKEFQEFIQKYTSDLDRKTTYDVISSHGREEELLYFSTAINDYNFVISYWVQRENWTEALKALNKRADLDIIYKYSTVLMAHSPTEFIDIVMRQSDIDARRLIPAILNYNQISDVPLNQNQGIRYLRFEINQRGSSDSAVHNTLLSMFASYPSKDETLLLAYLEAQTPTSVTTSKIETLKQLPYDADFALRLCLQHSRIRSCAFIFTIMGEYNSAVDLALEHADFDLAISIAERPENGKMLQKKLWLAIAKAVISKPEAAIGLSPSVTINSSTINASTKQSRTSPEPKGLAIREKSSQNQASIQTALTLLRRAPEGILKIEDVLPLLPDTILIDAFKDEICSALASYSASIDELKASMDASAESSARIQAETASLSNRWVLLEPGEACAVCGEVLLERRFWVWACGHGVHADCAVKEVGARGTPSIRGRVRLLRERLEIVGIEASKREEAVKELDELVGADCVRCGEVAVRSIDEPFVVEGAGAEDWSL